jgi:hypothetical protein
MRVRRSWERVHTCDRHFELHRLDGPPEPLELAHAGNRIVCGESQAALFFGFGSTPLGYATRPPRRTSSMQRCSDSLWARIFQTIGLPFLFIPITAASYLGLPPEKTGETSSLINVARNLGGSIGIAIAGAVLARNAQVHQSYLTSHLVPSSLPYQQALEAAICAVVG